MSALLADVAGAGVALGGLAVFAILGLAYTVFWIMMLVNIIQTPDTGFRAGNTIVWVLVLIFAPLGPVIYYFVGKPQTA